MMTKDFEKDLLIKFFQINKINTKRLIKSLDKVYIVGRAYTGRGFFAWLEKHKCLKINKRQKINGTNLIGAKINENKIEAKFLFHIEKDYIVVIEGFTDDNSWPEKITCYDLFEVQGLYRESLLPYIQDKDAFCSKAKHHMKATDFEKDILLEIFKIEHIDSKDLIEALDEIEVYKRYFSGAGFFTDLTKHMCLKVAGSDQSFKWNMPDAYLNKNKIVVGFLIHIEKGYIETIEGFTYGEEWPEEIQNYDFSRTDERY